MNDPTISPELALIDPELAEAARRRLPPKPTPAPRRVEPRVLSDRRLVGRRTASAARLLRVTAILAATVGLGYATAWGITTYTDVLGPRHPRAVGVESGSAPAARPPAQPEQQSTTPATAAVSLVWPEVRDASYYDLILWRNGRRLLDLWPLVPHVDVPRAWMRAGTRHVLAPGQYQWFVYPGKGARSEQRFGPLAASGSFVVGNRASTP